VFDAPVELEQTKTIASEAAALVLSSFGTSQGDAESKGPRDVVTEADRRSEAFIRERLVRQFPRDGIIGEEGTRRESASGRTWFIDPLDGTVNYARLIPIWCVSVALFQGREPILGVIVDPIRKETFWAAAGSGAWCNRDRLRCTQVADPAEAMVHMTVDFNDESMLTGLEDIKQVAPKVLRTRNTGSAALALAWLAAGRFDAMTHRFAHPWDYGAGVLLVKEAGGAVIDVQGGDFSDETHAVVAAATEPLNASIRSLRGSGLSCELQCALGRQLRR